jgi:F-type H+-transporting ATPase subunit delta
MIVTAVAKRYAKALFELAQEHARLDAILAEFQSFLRLLEQSPELKFILKHPNDRQREQVLSHLFQQRVSELFLNFLSLVLKNRRYDLLRQIYDDLQSRHDALNNRVRAIATTAIPLSEQKLSELSREIARLAQADVRLENNVDPSILGGIIIQLNGQIFDASIREQFKKLKQSLITNQK